MEEQNEQPIEFNSRLDLENLQEAVQNIKTEIGKVKITNRPSQEGTINGILVE